MPGCATLVFSREFDEVLNRMPAQAGELIIRKITAMAQKLDLFPHYRMTGREECRLRIGDYRVIYNFDRDRNEVHLVTLGHRREVYRT